jgi:2-oxoisovalerate dehydrogenase E1 component
MDKSVLLKAYRLMCLEKFMAECFEKNRNICKYVHATSRGHEAIQLATALQLTPSDYVSPYYRDDALLLGLGFSPYELMLQLLAKKDDPFSGGRSYYSHPSSRDNTKPTIIHQSSATGMQVIPTTGIAQGIRHIEKTNPSLMPSHVQQPPVVVCSMGDASVTEGEVSEAFQFAILKELPVLYLVQDNNWGISVTAGEARKMNAAEYAKGFPGLKVFETDGTDFHLAWNTVEAALEYVRTERKPALLRAEVPLLNHHTSGVRKEFYRTNEELQEASRKDPFVLLRNHLVAMGESLQTLALIESEAEATVLEDFQKAYNADDPDPEEADSCIFLPTPITEEKGNRNENGNGAVVMVDAALFAIRELMEKHEEIVVYGQDVGKRLGGVFRETATLGERFGEERVFNTAIQEAYIIGSTIGMTAVGLKPIVEVQFADYIYPGLNQLVSEISKSCYLTKGKFPVPVIIRIPTGAYGGGGPYHSGSIETTLLSIKGIKIAYPSTAADMKGLMKAAFYDPNPVVMLEHKGLYWSKVPGTEKAKTPEPDSDYILPLGKGRIVLQANENEVAIGNSCCIITYGMGVYWALAAAEHFRGCVEIVDLRTLYPLDETLIYATVKKHGKCLVLTEEQQNNSFAEALAGRISGNCFSYLDAPVQVLGAANVPAIPINIRLEEKVLPNAGKVAEIIADLLER